MKYGRFADKLVFFTGALSKLQEAWLREPGLVVQADVVECRPRANGPWWTHRRVSIPLAKDKEGNWAVRSLLLSDSEGDPFWAAGAVIKAWVPVEPLGSQGKGWEKGLYRSKSGEASWDSLGEAALITSHVLDNGQDLGEALQEAGLETTEKQIQALMSEAPAAWNFPANVEIVATLTAGDSVKKGAVLERLGLGEHRGKALLAEIRRCLWALRGQGLQFNWIAEYKAALETLEALEARLKLVPRNLLAEEQAWARDDWTILN